MGTSDINERIAAGYNYVYNITYAYAQHSIFISLLMKMKKSKTYSLYHICYV